MASASASAAAIPSAVELKNVIYARCCSQLPQDKLLSQNDILALEVVPNNDADLLKRALNLLLKEGLFRLHQQPTGPVWKVMKKEDAERYQSMTPDEAMIYGYIDAAGREAIWSRTIKLRANLHQSVMTRCIKSLESRGYIKSIKSVRWPNRVFYMLSSLQPSEDVTGGPWFTDGELDTDFIDILCGQIALFVESKSFYRGPSSGRGVKKDGKRKVSKPELDEALAKEFAEPRPKSKDRLMHFPPGYRGYPTLHEIMAWLNSSGISEVPLTEEHVRQLMDILYYDRRVQKVLGGTAYKAERRISEAESSHPGNGLTEAPCGRCPVFSLCEEGGPVSASNCEYFKEWLDF